MGKFLTPKQKQVLEYIQSFHQRQGYAPSQQEIAKHFGFSSLGTVQHYLNQLESLGLLQKSWNARRGLSFSTEGQPDAPREEESNAPQRFLPLLGKVAAGRPIEAAANLGVIEVPSSMLGRGGDHFVLRVQGDSMIGDGILDGDLVIVRKQETAQNGDTVVAQVDNEATIKRYYQKRGRVELHAANPAYPPILLDGSKRFRIEGVLAGLIRKS